MRSLSVLLGALVLSSGAFAQTAIKFALDWRFEGPAAPYFVAIDQGYYAAEGLDVSIDPGSGSVEGINRVASGAYQVGFADINSLIKFRDNPSNAPIQGIQMVYDTPAFAIISMKKSGIAKPKDLEGRILGAPAPDGAYAQWPIFAAANGIDAAKVRIENVGFPVREPMLVKGDVDAITGFWFSSYMNLKANGAQDDDIAVMLMKDFGVDLYGNVIIVNPAFAKSNPEAVKGFVKATIRGIQETLKNPDAAIDSLLKRNQIANRAVELERLQLALGRNFVTDTTRANGFGDVDMARLSRSIDQIGLTFSYTNKPVADAIFTSEFLPPKADRLVP